MMGEKSDTDEIDLLRKRYSTPVMIDVQKLASIRASELKNFDEHIGPSTITCRAITGLQKLPVRLRRRATSQNPKRLPRRLHYNNPVEKNTAKEILSKRIIKKSGKTLLKFKYSRRKRRRIQRLRILAKKSIYDYKNSLLTLGKPEKSCWLPTHLWHSKRCHMIDLWNWKIPYSRTDKNYRSCQESAFSRCVCYDISYNACLQLGGDRDHILKSILKLCSFNSYNAAKDFDSYQNMNCAFELSALLHSDVSPQSGITYAEKLSRKIICPVKITVLEKITNSDTIMWIWLHPSAVKEGFSFVAEAFKELDSTSTVKTTITLKMGDLCRFSVHGKFSHCLLKDTLVPSNLGENDRYVELWKKICASTLQAANLPNGLVIPMKCKSFRTNRPKLKLHNRYWLCSSENSIKDQEDSLLNMEDVLQLVSNIDGFGNFSELFKSTDDISVNDTLIHDETEYESPILLIQNGNSSLRSNYPSTIGWDVVMPRYLLKEHTNRSVVACHSKDFLVSCVYRGAEVGGIRDYLLWAGQRTDASASFELFPFYIWQDTHAGVNSGNFDRNSMKQEINNSLENTTDGNPVIDLIKKALVNTEYQADNFFILRDSAFLMLVVGRMLVGEKKANLSVEQLRNYNKDLHKACFAVTINCPHRGNPLPFCKLYAPKSRKQLMEFRKKGATRKLHDDARLVGFVTEATYNEGIGNSSGMGIVSLVAVANHLKSVDFGLQHVYMESREKVISIVDLNIVVY